MALPDILYHGSVKDIRGTQQDNAPLLFEFSDRYSVFDWGEMPDTLPRKGNALGFLSWAFFDLLEKEGVPTHMIGLVDENGTVLDEAQSLSSDSNLLTVEKKSVLPPTVEQTENGLVWNYTKYKDRPLNCLVPLEVIFRFGIPQGSSLLKRVGDTAYCQSLGLDTPPQEGDRFATPVIEFSTKLENYDRYLPYDTAKDIAGLSDIEFNRLIETTKKIAHKLQNIFAQMNIDLWDGKFEYAFSKETDAAGQRDILLIDSIGPDELRLTYDGVALSKQCLRDFYRGSTWEGAVEQAKALADARGVQDWKDICITELQQTPPALDPVLKETVAMLYTGMAKEIAKTFYNTAHYQDAWDLADVASSLKKWKDDNGKS